MFGRRYRSGVGLDDEDGAAPKLGEDGLENMVDWGRAAKVIVLRLAVEMEESSLEPDLWLMADRSDEEEEEVVEIDAGAGYRERLPFPPSV